MTFIDEHADFFKYPTVYPPKKLSIKAAVINFNRQYKKYYSLAVPFADLSEEVNVYSRAFLGVTFINTGCRLESESYQHLSARLLQKIYRISLLRNWFQLWLAKSYGEAVTIIKLGDAFIAVKLLQISYLSVNIFFGYRAGHHKRDRSEMLQVPLSTTLSQ
ncbi:hypothetical protein J6590_019113 [Homalodisca vitripennis]|nr:hypothetical protein J6590_019113 [Homalodisca vitripennis]